MKLLICLADGSEEIEFTVPMDVLRRVCGEEHSVIVAKVGGEDVKNLHVKGSNGGLMTANIHISEVKDEIFDAIIIPGGYGGSQCCGKSQILLAMLKKQKDSERLYAAICAAPVLVLGNNGLLEGKKNVCCYPSMIDQLPNHIDAESRKKQVNIDGNLITSQGPGTSFIFAFAIVQKLFGQQAEQDLKKKMVVTKWW